MAARRETLEDPRCEVHLLGALLAGELDAGPPPEAYARPAHRAIAVAVTTLSVCGEEVSACAVDLELARMGDRAARDVLLEVMSDAMPHPVPQRLVARVEALARKRVAVEALRRAYLAVMRDEWQEAARLVTAIRDV